MKKIYWRPQSTPLFAFVLSVSFFGEPLTVRKAVGVGLVAAGSILLK